MSRRGERPRSGPWMQGVGDDGSHVGDARADAAEGEDEADVAVPEPPAEAEAETAGLPEPEVADP